MKVLFTVAGIYAVVIAALIIPALVLTRCAL